MKKKGVCLILSCLVVIALLLASCGPAAVEEEEEKTAVGKVVEKEGKVIEEEEEEDAVVVTPTGEKSKYGGAINALFQYAVISFDPVDLITFTGVLNSYTHDNLAVCDWWVDRSICEFQGHAMWRQDVWTGSLAESWEQNDPLTITYKIRKGVHWQNVPPVNGREFTADDVVYTFERLLASPKLATHLLQNIETVTAPDKYTVVFTFEEPSIVMLNWASMGQACVMVAQEVVEEYGDLKQWYTSIGTGPWIIEDFVSDSSMTFKRNPDYFGRDPDGNSLPYADGVNLLLISDSATQIAALRTGKLDVHELVSWTQKPSLEQTNPQLQWRERLAGAPFVLSIRNDTPPFDNIKVRYALQMGMNREEIAETLFQGNAELWDWNVKPEEAGCYIPFDELPEELQEVYTYNPEKAKQLLTEAGYPNGFKMQTEYSLQYGTIYGDMMELVKAYWDRIGVDLELRPVDHATYSSIKYGFTYEHCLSGPMGIGMFINHVAGFYRTGAQWNRCRISDPYIDEMYDKAAAEFDYYKRNEILKELNLYLIEQCHAIVPPDQVNWCAWQPWVMGFQGEASIGHGGYSQGAILAYIWIDQDLRYEMTGMR